MSAQHGVHGEDNSISGIIVSIILALLGIGPIRDKIEEVTTAVVVGPMQH